MSDDTRLIAEIDRLILAMKSSDIVYEWVRTLQRCRDRLAQQSTSSIVGDTLPHSGAPTSGYSKSHEGAPITDAEVQACLEPLFSGPDGPSTNIDGRAEQMQGVIRRLAHPAVTQTGWRNLYLNWRQIAEKLERGITIARASCERKDKALREFLDAVRGHGWEDCDPTTAEARAVRFARATLSDTQEPGA